MLLIQFEVDKKALESKRQEAISNAVVGSKPDGSDWSLDNPDNIKLDAAALKLQDLEHLEATESDYDLITEDELNTLTESRRNSQVYEATTTPGLLAEQGITSAEDGGNKIKTTRQDFIVLMIVAWVSFMVGCFMEDFLFSVYQES